MTLRFGTRLACWATMRMPSCWPRSGFLIACGSPPRRISPASHCTAPVRMRESVLLPAPFSPTMACTSPLSAERSTARSACVPPKRLLMPIMCRNGVTPEYPRISNVLCRGRVSRAKSRTIPGVLTQPSGGPGPALQRAITAGNDALDLRTHQRSGQASLPALRFRRALSSRGRGWTRPGAAGLRVAGDAERFEQRARASPGSPARPARRPRSSCSRGWSRR